MAVCRPCRHGKHEACKKEGYRTAGCLCKMCGPHPNPFNKAVAAS
jgi:hypothetical protein